jgi:glycosyltransferase involved in cell wall biosynthesis
MKKRIWIINHYATRMFFEQGGRHLWMAAELKKQGYEPIILCADRVHNGKEVVDTGEKGYTVKQYQGIPFLFFKTRPYEGNGGKRVANMWDFYHGLMKQYGEVAGRIWKPDVILASSVHPLTLLAGIRIAKKMGIPCISEVRDLWPESLVAYGALKAASPATKVLYQGEKYLYKKSHAVIITFEGGKQYILDKGWEKEIPLSKIYYINNGVDVHEFERHSIDYPWPDSQLSDGKYHVTYTGSLRRVNDVGILLDAAKLVAAQGLSDVEFLIYGEGNERAALEERVREEQIDNVFIKGPVDKKYIPYILRQSHINVLQNASTILDRYGQSQNKYFEYMAAGRFILQTYKTGYSVLERENCGLLVEHQTPEEIAKAIGMVYNMPVEAYQQACEKTRALADEFDFSVLTGKLIEIIERV